MDSPLIIYGITPKREIHGNFSLNWSIKTIIIFIKKFFDML
jgi:hypothetical protein